MSLILLGILNSQVSGGAAGAYDLLETQVLSSSAASVTFTGLGSYSDYKHLQVRAVVQASFAATSLAAVRLSFNGTYLSGTYRDHELRGDGSAVSSTSGANNFIDLPSLAPYSDATNIYGAFVCDVLDFANASKNTTVKVLGGGITSTDRDVALYSGLWVDTSAVTSLQINGPGRDFTAGSRFSLYGVRG